MQERTFIALQIIKKTFYIVYMIISVNGISYVDLMTKNKMNNYIDLF